MLLKPIAVFSFALLLSSCAFNKLFLRPTVTPADAKLLVLRSASDTMYVRYGAQFQPTFLEGDAVTETPLDYTIESVVFESANGSQINGWLMKPKGVEVKTTLVHFHGNAGCLLYQYQAMAPLLKYGYQAFVFDYSGFGFSTGKATRKNVLIDANSALDYVLASEAVKDTKVVIYGQSLGGHLSAVVASERQNDIDALVIEGAFSSHRDIAADMVPVLGKIFVVEKYNGFKDLRDYKKPVLVIHSTEDDVIPFRMGQKLYANANEPKQFYEIRGCHMCGPELYTDSIVAKMERMLTVEL
jgi:uncharacterized protein